MKPEEETNAKPFTLETGLPINKVRDPEFAASDDRRAKDALSRIWNAAQGGEDITLDDAECSMIISLMQSQEYFRYICSKMEN
jgi:hypothetical protein